MKTQYFDVHNLEERPFKKPPAPGWRGVEVKVGLVMKSVVLEFAKNELKYWNGGRDLQERWITRL